MVQCQDAANLKKDDYGLEIVARKVETKPRTDVWLQSLAAKKTPLRIVV